jgi:hypothetical protein
MSKSLLFYFGWPTGTHGSTHVQLMPARARVHGGHQHETRGEAERHRRARDAERSILQRLAEHLEDIAGEFRVVQAKRNRGSLEFTLRLKITA